ncbi:unnamed protein product [Lactuca saligna]|uniref:ABC transporter domain-containing protein n=1 Tax=Lactuca saligna TaxID=75948 RepID=A0AA35Y4B1_LACSI|nr:unnamed protein product [Lactuca saligna]
MRGASMVASTDGSSSSGLWTQCNALFRKNLNFQRRNVKTNLRLILFPLVLCLLLVSLQTIVNIELDKAFLKCGCTCIDKDGDGECERVCGIEYSDLDQVATCSIPSPPEWPPLLQVPAPQYRAVRTDRLLSFGDFPDDSCTSTPSSCPTTVLMTGNNQSLGESLARNMFSSSFNYNSSNGLADVVLGTTAHTKKSSFLEPSFFSGFPVYYLQSQCRANSTFSISVPLASTIVEKARNQVRNPLMTPTQDLTPRPDGPILCHISMSNDYLQLAVLTSGSGARKSPLFFLHNLKSNPSKSFRNPLSSFRLPSLQRKGSKVYIELEKPDIVQEKERVELSLLEQDKSHAIVCDNLKKVYPGRDGNPEKLAVRGLSLALSTGECFGMLGPNGAGKTSFINMMIGLVKPSSGTAYVRGLDIRSDMDEIYANMGVCPQHDLLWETLTGREHLLFYGRLKNLKGAVLTQAVEESLRSMNLLNGGIADKQVGKYSGGMKRRLSVAISLIGDPKVVYMDEPSTGLDPTSRKNLWNVVKRAKQNCAIILTTHSMEEAENLCDRLGIFVDGRLQCVGNPKELKGRYGGSYVFTMTTSSNHEADVENIVKGLSPYAKKIYDISGTQKFELPKEAIKIADVFRAVENAKSRFVVQAWGITDTTLEDVFIKVAREAQPFDVLS